MDERVRLREREEEYRKNAEARFASPEDSNVGIGYYDDDGEPLTPEQFRERVAEDAAKARAEGEKA